MGVLILGLALFLGVHSLRIVGLRDAVARAMGEGWFALVYSMISAAGLALIVYGFILAHPSQAVWTPPAEARFAPYAATPLAFVLLVSAYVPGKIRAVLRHPMTLAVALWSGGHLLASHQLASVVLFGSFFAWSALLLAAVFLRGGAFPGGGRVRFDLVAILLGLAAAGATAYYHMQLFGVAVIDLASETGPPGI